MGFARRESCEQCPQQPLSLQTVFDDYSFFFKIFFFPHTQACSRQTYHSILYLLHIFFIITLFIFVVRTYECGVAVNTVILNPNPVELISGDANGCIKIWDLETNSCKGEIFQSEVLFFNFFIIIVILFYYPHSLHTVFFNIIPAAAGCASAVLLLSVAVQGRCTLPGPGLGLVPPRGWHSQGPCLRLCPG